MSLFGIEFGQRFKSVTHIRLRFVQCVAIGGTLWQDRRGARLAALGLGREDERQLESHAVETREAKQ